MSGKKKLLLTGGSGFVGRNILPILKQFYDVDAPTRAELNLLHEEAVNKFIEKGQYDLIVHSANSTPAKNAQDLPARHFYDSLKVYFNLAKNRENFGRMFYLGSGAEYDKRFDITCAEETAIGKHIPTDDYGFAKYIMNEDARKSDNIYNLRVFGCYGPTDAKTKFIRDAIDCCLEGRAITIRQDCYFDYMYVEDLARVVLAMSDIDLRFKDYNICTGIRKELSAIARIVAKQMGNDKGIEIVKTGMNREYTASNKRFSSEFPDFTYTSLEDGISKQIAWQRSMAI